MSPSTIDNREVDERWQSAGSGEHYVSDRWRGSRAKDRDPRLIRRLLRSLPTGEEIHSILDVPSGTGRLRGAFEAPLVVQADISMSMLQSIPSEARGQGLLQASVQALPFTDSAFDLVVCCRLLHHLRDGKDRAQVLREAMRVSSRFVIASYWDAQSYGAWRRRTQGPLRRRKRADVREAISYAELEGQVEAAGGRVLTRAHSFRFVSQQSFLLAEKLS